jgi:hypothetical protein
MPSPVLCPCLMLLVMCGAVTGGEANSHGPATAGAAAQAWPAMAQACLGTWQLQADGESTYLTIDGTRAVVQNGGGELLAAFRVRADATGLVCLHHGTPTTVRLTAEAGGVALGEAGGERTLYMRCSAPPEAIGWSPYTLPEPAADPASRQATAKELISRFETEQRLLAEAMRASQGRMDAATMQTPAVRDAWKAVNAADEDNRTWLERTLRTQGWIGRKSHGGKAHEALLFIAVHTISHLRLAATIRQQFALERTRGEIDEMSLAMVSDRFDLVILKNAVA